MLADCESGPAETKGVPESVRRDLRWRWVILGMLFVSTFLNYFDRQTVSVLKPTLKAEFGIGDYGYAQIVTAFLVTYTIAYAISGRLVDRIGHRISLSLFVGIWSLANMAIGFSRSLGQLALCRVIMGAAESGNYPAALRATTSWFPAHLRGSACGAYQAGSATAAVVAVPIIALMATHWRWRSVFILPGVVGLLWVAAWWWICRDPSAEYAGRNLEPQSTQVIPLAGLVGDRNVWGIVLARLVSDQVWYFCLFWMPGYLQENLKLTLLEAGWIGWLPFLCADLGGLLGGVVSDRFIAAGWNPCQARKRVLIGTALAAPLGILIPFAQYTALAIALFCIVAVVCQVWLFGLTTLVSDVFPRTSVASVLGISGAFGALGGLLSSQLIGLFVGRFGFVPIFLVLGCLHIVAAITIHFLVHKADAETSLPAGS